MLPNQTQLLPMQQLEPPAPPAWQLRQIAINMAFTHGICDSYIEQMAAARLIFEFLSGQSQEAPLDQSNVVDMVLPHE